MEEYRIPTDDELCELANDYVGSLSNEDFPISEESLTEEILEDFVNEYGYRLVGNQINDLIDYIVSSSEEVYNQMVEDASQKFRNSLDYVITGASEILSDENKLKIIIEVASRNFCEYY